MCGYFLINSYLKANFNNNNIMLDKQQLTSFLLNCPRYLYTVEISTVCCKFGYGK